MCLQQFASKDGGGQEKVGLQLIPFQAGHKWWRGSPCPSQCCRWITAPPQAARAQSPATSWMSLTSGKTNILAKSQDTDDGLWDRVFLAISSIQVGQEFKLRQCLQKKEKKSHSCLSNCPLATTTYLFLEHALDFELLLVKPCCLFLFILLLFSFLCINAMHCTLITTFSRERLRLLLLSETYI